MKKLKQPGQGMWFFVGIILFFFAIISLFVFAYPKSVDLEVVLKGSGVSLGNEGIVLFSVLAFTLAFVSVAKGYELFKKEKEGHNNSLSFKVAELTSSNHKVNSFNKQLLEKNQKLKKEKHDFYFKINDMQDRVSHADEQEKLLHKSIMVLKRDIEKLLGQKEQLLMDLNSKDLELKMVSNKKKKTKSKKKVSIRRKKNAKA